MTQELPIAGIVAVLKQVVQQPTDALAALVGVEAVQAAHALMHRVEAELEPTTVKRFRERPERTQQLEDDLADVAAQNSTFAADLRELYAKYEAAAKSKPAASGIHAEIKNAPDAMMAIGDGNIQVRDVKGSVVNIGGTMNAGDIAGRGVYKAGEPGEEDG